MGDSVASKRDEYSGMFPSGRKVAIPALCDCLSEHACSRTTVRRYGQAAVHVKRSMLALA